MPKNTGKFLLSDTILCYFSGFAWKIKYCVLHLYRAKSLISPCVPQHQYKWCFNSKLFSFLTKPREHAYNVHFFFFLSREKLHSPGSPGSYLALGASQTSETCVKTYQTQANFILKCNRLLLFLQSHTYVSYAKVLEHRAVCLSSVFGFYGAA